MLIDLLPRGRRVFSLVEVIHLFLELDNVLERHLPGSDIDILGEILTEEVREEEFWVMMC